MSIHRVAVDAYTGYNGEATPRSFTVEGVSRAVIDIVDRWYTDSNLYFRVKTNDGERYVLRYHLDEEWWELVMQERS